MDASNGISRSIRLKEYSPGLVRPTHPGDAYLARTDGSLPQDKIVLRSDNNGFIMTGNNLAGPRKKIIVMGDSFVESHWVPDDKGRWVSKVESLLEQAFPGQYVLNNAGYSGATSLHLAVQLPTKMRALFSDVAGVIIVVPTNNDAEVFPLQHTYWTKNRYWSPLEPIDHPGELPTSRFDAVQDTYANWSMMLQYLASYRIPALVVAPPYRDGVWAEDAFLQKIHKSAEAFENWKTTRNRIIEIGLNVAADFQVPIMDTRKILSDDQGVNVSCFYDMLHLNAKGQNLFADLFVKEFLDKQFWYRTGK